MPDCKAVARANGKFLHKHVLKINLGNAGLQPLNGFLRKVSCYLLSAPYAPSPAW